MNASQVHLLTNHLPLYMIVFGAIAMSWSLLRNSREMRWAALGLFVLAGGAAWVATQSGEEAEDLIVQLSEKSEVKSVKSFIHEHEEAAETANAFAVVLAIGALCVAVLVRFRPQHAKAAQIVLLTMAIVSSGLMARAAHFGGQVRHTEIRSSEPRLTDSD